MSRMVTSTSTMDVDPSIEEGGRRRRENTGNYQLLTATRDERMKGRSRACALGGGRDSRRGEREDKTTL